jgi:hypothetical protein
VTGSLSPRDLHATEPLSQAYSLQGSLLPWFEKSLYLEENYSKFIIWIDYIINVVSITSMYFVSVFRIVISILMSA